MLPFQVGEVMLNYAEAAFELGRFTQEVADATINKLRARGGTKNMTVGQIDADWDTKRDSDVAPVLWEIRRERVMELATEGFHFDDLRRWKKKRKKYSTNNPAEHLSVKQIMGTAALPNCRMKTELL